MLIAECFQHIDTFAAKVYVSVSAELPSEVFLP